MDAILSRTSKYKQCLPKAVKISSVKKRNNKPKMESFAPQTKTYYSFNLSQEYDLLIVNQKFPDQPKWDNLFHKNLLFSLYRQKRQSWPETMLSFPLLITCPTLLPITNPLFFFFTTSWSISLLGARVATWFINWLIINSIRFSKSLDWILFLTVLNYISHENSSWETRVALLGVALIGVD